MCRIHDSGLVHRDVRLENIIIFGDKARLIDFGFATPPVFSNSGIIGTVTTASQNVLIAALNGDPIAYEPRDDLESLLKVFLMHAYDFKVAVPEKTSYTKALYDAWKQKIRACRTKNTSYDELKAYLVDVFDGYNETWKRPRIAPNDDAMINE